MTKINFIMKHQMKIMKKNYIIILDSDGFYDILDIPLLKGDKEVKEGKGLKVLTSKKLLTRLPILLTQIKAGSNKSKLKNEITQILYLLHQHNKITKNFYKNLIKSL